MNSKGFTLIELLVVIAIIGILASVVLVSFPGAQSKARDSRVISAISQMRTVLTYVYANEGSWPASIEACTSTEIANLCEEVKNNAYDATTTIYTGTNAEDWCIYARLNEKDGRTWYCASGDGRAGFTQDDDDPGATGACDDDTSWVCPSPLRGE